MKTLVEYLTKSFVKIIHDKKNMLFKTNGGELTYLDFPVTTGVNLDAIEIQSLYVTNRRNGIGSELVKACIEYANEINKDIVLYASPLGDGISEDELIKFYINNGFEILKDKILVYYQK